MTSIRQEKPEDTQTIRDVNEQAFGRPAEADLVDALRSRQAVALSLVAFGNTTVVGHILFSPIYIVSANTTLAGVALGPMAVLPSHQRQGVGASLVRRGLEWLTDAGHNMVVVLGHPEYYPRFGFTPASHFGIECPYDVPDDVFMALELRERARPSGSATVRYQPEFNEV